MINIISLLYGLCNNDLTSLILFDRDTAVKIVEKKGIDLNAIDENQSNPLLTAALFNDYEMVKLLLRNGSNIHFRNRYGENALKSAFIGKGDYRLIKLLMDHGASLDQDWHRMALHYALYKKDKKLVDLVASMVDVNKINSRGDTYLMEVMQSLDKHGHLDMLLELNVNFNQINPYNGETAFSYLVKVASYFNGLSTKVLKYLPLVDNIHYRDRSGRNVLISIAGGNAFDLVSIAEGFLAAGSSINDSDNDGNTALHRAVIAKNTNLVEFLLKNGANPNFKNHNGDTPYYLVTSERMQKVFAPYLVNKFRNN